MFDEEIGDDPASYEYSLFTCVAFDRREHCAIKQLSKVSSRLQETLLSSERQLWNTDRYGGGEHSNKSGFQS